MAGKGIWEIEGEIHKRTGVSSARLKFKKNEGKSRYIRLCDRESTINGM